MAEKIINVVKWWFLAIFGIVIAGEALDYVMRIIQS